MRKNFISWDECFMRMTYVIAERSKDPSTQVGAVIVNPDNVVVGMGYNGFPRSVENEDFPWEREGDMLDTKYPYVVHAEANALYNSNAETKGSRIYVKLFPCNECAKGLIQNGIKEVIYESDKYHDVPAFIASRRMFDAAGVTYRKYSCEWNKENN
jgi:dCMP deaminase